MKVFNYLFFSLKIFLQAKLFTELRTKTDVKDKNCAISLNFQVQSTTRTTEFFVVGKSSVILVKQPKFR